MLVASISLSLAWINSQQNKIDGSNITGKILAQYFDRSATANSDADPGTAENPYVITRPQHWENLAKLHHSFEGFCEQNYVFEVGKVLTTAEGGDDTNYYVYSYDDKGVYAGGGSANLNLGGLSIIEPIGTEEYPFNSTIIGHDITISNFEVSPEAFEDGSNYDLGIFGYAGADASVSNLYFDNFKIDVANLNASGAVERENHMEHVNKCYTGYLCGHVYDVNSFQHVYLNNCEIAGTSNSFYTINSYGYFGYVEKDNAGADAGVGGNYKFDLNCQAIHEYLDKYYDNDATYAYDESNNELELIGLKDTEMRVRNTEYDAIINAPSTSFTTGLVREDEDYRLVGDYYSSGSHNSDRNYSFSTLGYFGTQTYEDVHKYETYYKDGDDYLVPSSSAKVTSYDKNYQQNAGDFYYYNGTKWEYYHSDNTIDMFNYTFTFGSVSNYSLGSQWLIVTIDYSIQNINLYLQIDDQIIEGVSNGTDSSKLNYRYTVNDDNQLSININDYSMSLCKGTHYVALLIQVETRALSYKTLDWYYGTLASSNTLVNERSFNVTGNGTMNITISGPQTQTGQNHKLSLGSSNSCIPIVNMSPNTISYELKGKEIDSNDNTVSDSYSDITVKTTSFDYDDELDLVIATTTERKLDEENPPGNVYISEDPDIRASGYSSKNIDIVGGGITFSDTYLNMSAEQAGGGLTVNPSTIGIGNKFYATQYCANSIVLYMKNAPGDDLGNITVNYTTLGAIFGVSLKSPSFKKGGGTFYDFSSNNFENYTSSDNGTSRSIKIDHLSRTEIQKASYCALDMEGNVTAIFDTSGNPTTDSNVDSISTYVVVLGVEMDDSIWSRILSVFTTNTRITSIHFEYKAEEGFSSALGPVDYRDQTSDDNIADFGTSGTGEEAITTYYNAFTFYYAIKTADVTYSFITEYEGLTTHNSVEKKWYVLTVSTTSPIELQICIYRPGYAVMVVCNETNTYFLESRKVTCG